MTRNAGRKRESLIPRAAAPIPKDTAHRRKSAPYWVACCRSCAATSDGLLHFCGATAIHLMLLPLLNNATATATRPKPIHMAHQSSLRNSSAQAEGRAERREWVRWAISVMTDSGKALNSKERLAVPWVRRTHPPKLGARASAVE